MAAAENAAASVPAFKSTQLWPIASFGSVPTLVSTTLICSPAFASIVVRLNFIVSFAVISTTRGPAAGALAAGVAAGILLSAAGAFASAVGAVAGAAAGVLLTAADAVSFFAQPPATNAMKR